MPEPARSEGEPETPATPDAASGGDTPDLAQAEEAAAREAAAEASPSGSGAGSGPKVVKPKSTTSRKVADRPAAASSKADVGADASEKAASASRRKSAEPAASAASAEPAAASAVARSVPETVYISQGGADRVTATNVDVSRGGIGRAERDRHRGFPGRHRARPRRAGQRRARRRRRGARRRGSRHPGRRRHGPRPRGAPRAVDRQDRDRERGQGRPDDRRAPPPRSAGRRRRQDDPRLARRARLRGGLRDRLDPPAPPQALVTSSSRGSPRTPTVFVAPGRGWQGGREHRKRAHSQVRERGAHRPTQSSVVQARQPSGRGSGPGYTPHP